MRLDAASLIERANAAPVTADARRRAIASLDLTSLDGGESDGDIRSLAERACANRTAAICVFPTFLKIAKPLLQGQGVALATVANFPAGGDDILAVAGEVASAVAAGADEVDVVAPIEAILAGDIGLVGEMIESCRDAAGSSTRLKLILETGRLERPELITAAARVAVMAGVDFLKTSTGKVPIGATPEAALALLAVISEAGGEVGLKLSGGVRTAEQAAFYLSLADQVMGVEWAGPQTFRFGASSLLDRLLGSEPARSSGY